MELLGVLDVVLSAEDFVYGLQDIYIINEYVISLNSYFMLANSGQIMTSNNGNLLVFEIGPSVKCVSAITDATFKENGGKFCFGL